MVLDYATCNIFMGSLSMPIGEQRVNIKFCVKLGKSATETYTKCTVMKFYHVHVCLNGKHFREAWETTQDDGISGRPSTLWTSEKIRMSPNSTYNKIVKLPSKCHRSWTSARWPVMKFCMRILVRGNWMPESCKSKRRIVLQVAPTFWKLQAKKTHSVLQSTLEMKNGAYSMTHKQKHKVQSGEAQAYLPQRNLVSSLQKQKQSWLCFWTAEGKNLFQKVKL